MKLSLFLFASLALSIAGSTAQNVSNTLAKSPGCDPEIHVCSYVNSGDLYSVEKMF